MAVDAVPLDGSHRTPDAAPHDDADPASHQPGAATPEAPAPAEAETTARGTAFAPLVP